MSALSVFVGLLPALALAQVGPGDLRRLQSHTADVCLKFAEEPIFMAEDLLGAPWRVYNTWNVKMDECFDVKFENATPAIVQKLRRNMADRLLEKPDWNSASLVATRLGKADHELLLFPDPKSNGHFYGVPNYVAVNAADAKKGSDLYPLMNIRLHLLEKSTYLLMMDCSLGFMSLYARSKPTPYRADIARVASELNVGDSFPSCLQDKNPEEHFN